MSRHTQPMTDAYMTGQRLRNAARTQCKIEQLGDRWLLHPDNAVTRDQHAEVRRARSERVETSLLRTMLVEEFKRVSSVRAAFLRHATEVFASGLIAPVWKTAPAGHGASFVGLLPFIPQTGSEYSEYIATQPLRPNLDEKAPREGGAQ